MFKRILIAVDGGDIAARAAETGGRLAATLHAEILLVFVVDPSLATAPEGGITPDVLLSSLEEEAKATLAALGKDLPQAEQIVRRGKPGGEVLKVAEERGVDLIVVGTQGRTGVRRVLMGSTAEDIVRHAPCPVLVIRAAS